MNKRTLIISSIVGLLTLGFVWFANGKCIDRLQKTNPKFVTNSQEQLDSLLITNNIKTENFSEKISGRFIIKGACCAGFDFINSTTVLWTNEIAPFEPPDTLKIRWLDNSTFMTRTTERLNKDCPPLIWIYQIISFDGQHLIVKDIWTGWYDQVDKRIEFIKQTNDK